jgi:membrane protease YdiL (CAAX protease family)
MLTPIPHHAKGEHAVTSELEEGPVDRGRTIRQLAAYFALAFAITWSLGALMIFARPRLEAVIGPIGQTNQHWLYFVAVCAPTISAVIVTAASGGWAGLRALAGRFVRPTHPIWVLAAIFIVPAALTAAELATRLAGPGVGIDLGAVWVGAPALAFTTLALVADPGGFGEETGWRGFALPRLLSLMGPLPAAVTLGLIWGIWHLPAFFVSDLAQAKFGLGWFLAGGISLTVVMTWLFVNANGNLMVAGVIPHLMWNLMFDAHVFRGKVIEVETTVIALIALLALASFGPTLRGWRGAARADARTASGLSTPAGE